MLKINASEKLPTPKFPLHPKFGTAFTPHVLQIDIDESSNAPLTARIVPLKQGETFTASSVVFHYGQSIFEGMKAFRQKDGSVAIFRPDLHAKRFMQSAEKLAMPIIGEEIFIKALEEFIRFEKDCVPSEPQHALYIRPLMIAREEIVKVGKATHYSFYVITCVVGSYFAGGQGKPAKVLVCREFVRAVPGGGLGEAKTSANYAASLAPQAHGESLGCDQVLYLDGVVHDFVDELGGMNFFVVRKSKQKSGSGTAITEIVTPSLNGAILHGVTRRSLMELAPVLGFKAVEEKISFNQLIADIKNGEVTEAFACGTAAVIHSIGEFVIQDTKTSEAISVKLPESTPVAKKLYETLTGIHHGEVSLPTSQNWLHKI